MERRKQAKSKIQEEQKLRQNEAEREAILMKADEVKGETLEIDFEGNIEIKNELDELLLEPIDNPEEKYALYYKVINRLLINNLPKGLEYKAARDLIYEEKNTFLTRGHRKDEKGVRGADGRMSYTGDMHEFVNIITTWIASRGTMYDLYVKLRDLNISKGYGG